MYEEALQIAEKRREAKGKGEKERYGCNVGDLGSVPGLGRSLEKDMATHTSVIVWKIPWIVEPSRLQSMGLQESEMT